jgi:5-carboxymethyl-2-hydroxymuconate isomerase
MLTIGPSTEPAMPHVLIEYSANLRDRIRVRELIGRLHETAIGTGVFPLAGTRTRAFARDDYRIADGHPDNGFVHVTLRVGHGRDLDTRLRAGRTVFEALCEHLAPVAASSPLAISFEVEEMHPQLSFRQNNLRDYLAAREAGRQAP